MNTLLETLRKFFGFYAQPVAEQKADLPPGEKRFTRKEVNYMTNQEQLEMLLRDIGEWNRWREMFPDVRPDFRGLGLLHIDYRPADLSGANLSFVNLTGANLANFNFKDANLFGTNLAGANLLKARLNGANLNCAQLINSRLKKANLSGASCIKADLSRANIDGANLTQATLENANLSGANLNLANLHKANLSGANLNRTNLFRSDLSEARLCGANLRHADLRETNLQKAALHKADLSYALIGSARLSKAVITDAVIHAADFTCARLFRTDFTKSDLSNSSLWGAELNETNFDRANLSHAIFYENNSGACGREDEFEIDDEFETDFDFSLEDITAKEPSFAGAVLHGADLDQLTSLPWKSIENAHINQATKLPTHLAEFADFSQKERDSAAHSAISLKHKIPAIKSGTPPQSDYVIFRCRICRLSLTRAINRTEDKSQLSFREEENIIPAGFYMIWDSGHGLRTGDYLINLQDTINTKLHSDRTRTNGCCGPGGQDGLNLVCINGHEVGTKSADCYMAHSITFTPEITTLEIV